MSNLSIRIFLFLVFCASVAKAQEKYWVFFKEREIIKQSPVSDKTLDNRKNIGLEVFQKSDYGPRISEIELLKKEGINIENKSRWFNAISAYLSKEQLSIIIKMPFVENVQLIQAKQSLASKVTSKIEDGFYLDFAIHQIHAEAFFERNWMGEGIDIGVIDGGFFEADKDEALKPIFESGRVIAKKDFFVPAKVDFFGEKKSNGDLHGTWVTKAIGGFNPKTKQIFGLGLKSNYYFARTESSQRESRLEEDNWIAAIEWLDSLGVRLANSSLGYATGFTNPAESYLPANMDGKTSLIGRGAQMAVREKGMILVVSAGNEGENQKWGGIVSTPGDVDEVISVGANEQTGMKMAYSSKGNENVDFIKPDITVFSMYGTSLAAPIVTGFVACLLQKNPFLKPNEVKEILRKSSSLNSSPNNYLGYGIPNAELAAQQLEGKSTETKRFEKVKAKKKFQIQVEGKDGIVVFHKKDAKNVILQNFEMPEKGKIIVEKPENAMYSTVVLPQKIIEIYWKN